MTDIFTAQEVQLARQPGDHIRSDDFRVVAVDLAELADGQVLVRNDWMTVEPYMRLALTSQQGLHPARRPGETMDGAALGTVVQSRARNLPEGTMVRSQMGWRTAFVADADTLSPLPASDNVPPSWHLGLLGMTGLTAFAGIERVLQPQADETILVSGAAGAVGSIACQLAQLRGARVLGMASTAEKLSWLTDSIGIDAAFNYRTENITEFLSREAPDGVDCYFDNVGGPILDAMLGLMRPNGRVGLCGAMAQYETGNYRRGPANFFAIIERGLTLRGFNVGQYATEAPAIIDWLAEQALAGRIRVEEQIVNGIEAAPQAFVSLFGAGAIGKVLVRLTAAETI